MWSTPLLERDFIMSINELGIDQSRSTNHRSRCVNLKEMNSRLDTLSYLIFSCHPSWSYPILTRISGTGSAHTESRSVFRLGRGYDFDRAIVHAV